MTSAGELPLDVDTFEAVRHFAEWRGRGRVAVMSCVEITSHGDFGILKVNPEFSEEEIAEMHEVGVFPEPDTRPIMH
jgi:hypothetical protein